MNAKIFQENVKASFLNQFPNGYINVSKLALGGGVNIRCGLIGNKEDLENGIRENDPMRISIFIHDGIQKDDETNDISDEKLVLEYSSSTISVKPSEPIYFCESKKIPSRKITATPEKAIARLDKYFQRVKAFVDNEAKNENIINQNKIDKKYI